MLTTEEIKSRLTLDNLIKFLESKDPSAVYDYSDGRRHCPWAQIVEAEENKLVVYPDGVYHDRDGEEDETAKIAALPPVLDYLVRTWQADYPHRSYGGALQLAKQVRDGQLIYDEENSTLMSPN